MILSDEYDRRLRIVMTMKKPFMRGTLCQETSWIIDHVQNLSNNWQELTGDKSLLRVFIMMNLEDEMTWTIHIIPSENDVRKLILTSENKIINLTDSKTVSLCKVDPIRSYSGRIYFVE